MPPAAFQKSRGSSSCGFHNRATSSRKMTPSSEMAMRTPGARASRSVACPRMRSTKSSAAPKNPTVNVSGRLRELDVA
eukprot:6502041-Prymnesium_polylepis.2